MQVLQTLRVGVVGLGVMGRIHVNHLVDGFAGVVLAAVADPRIEDIMQSGVVQFPSSVQPYADYREFTRLNLDAVIIASSTTTHETVLRDLHPTGTPIFCEKPLAVGLDDALALHHEIQRRHAIVQMGFMRRFDPIYQRAKQLIDEGKIGNPYHYWGQSRDQFAPPIATARTSGGFLVDTGVHEFDAARWLLNDEIESVFARGGVYVSHDLADMGDVDEIDLSFRTRGRRQGAIELTRNAIYGYDVRAEILGDRGSVQVVSGNRTTAMLMVENQVIGDTYANYAQRFEAAYRNELAAFFEVVRKGSCPLVTSEDAVQAQTIAMSAHRSLSSERSEAVALIAETV